MNSMFDGKVLEAMKLNEFKCRDCGTDVSWCIGRLCPNCGSDFRAPRKLDRVSEVELPNVDKAEENKAIKYYQDNKEALKAAYLKDHPVTVDSDIAKEYFRPIGYNGLNANSFHEAASMLSNDIYKEEMAVRKGKGNNTVLLTAGGPGAGKTTAVNQILKDENFPIIYDSSMSNVHGSRNRIKMALANGYKIDVAVVLRRPQDAWVGGVLKRTASGDRHVNLHTFMDLTSGFPESIRTLQKEFGDAVNFHIIENNSHGNVDDVKEVGIEKMDEFDNYMKSNAEEIKNELREETKAAVNKGSITPEQVPEIYWDDNGNSIAQGTPDAGTQGAGGELVQSRKQRRQGRVEPKQITDLEAKNDKSIPKANKGGNCYQDVYKYMDQHRGKPLIVAHGMVDGQGPVEGYRFGHAWIENGNDCIDPTNGKMNNPIVLPKQVYYAMGHIGDVQKYNVQDYLQQLVTNKTYGPWKTKAKPTPKQPTPPPKQEPLASQSDKQQGQDMNQNAMNGRESYMNQSFDGKVLNEMRLSEEGQGDHQRTEAWWDKKDFAKKHEEKHCANCKTKTMHELGKCMRCGDKLGRMQHAQDELHESGGQCQGCGDNVEHLFGGKYCPMCAHRVDMKSKEHDQDGTGQDAEVANEAQGQYQLKTEKYSWGILRKISTGPSGINFSCIIHPEDWEKIRPELVDPEGPGVNFKDEQGKYWKVNSGDWGMTTFKELNQGNTIEVPTKELLAKFDVNESVNEMSSDEREESNKGLHALAIELSDAMRNKDHAKVKDVKARMAVHEAQNSEAGRITGNESEILPNEMPVEVNDSDQTTFQFDEPQHGVTEADFKGLSKQRSRMRKAKSTQSHHKEKPKYARDRPMTKREEHELDPGDNSLSGAQVESYVNSSFDGKLLKALNEVRLNEERTLTKEDKELTAELKNLDARDEPEAYRSIRYAYFSNQFNEPHIMINTYSGDPITGYLRKLLTILGYNTYFDGRVSYGNEHEYGFVIQK